MKIKTEFAFDAAHRLIGHQGKCANLHGHIWKVRLDIEGTKLDGVGMMWDFGYAKEIEKLLDHKTILKNCKENENLIKLLHSENNKVYLMDENPTAEHLCKEILTLCISSNPKLKYTVTVWESPKSFAQLSK